MSLGQPVPGTEHRLALVMNGGVSLAVWMGGVACEIDNVRRASNGIGAPPGASDAERALHDLWREITGALKVRVSVDVIAGTSAGGLNGALLGAAIARGAALSGLKKLWLDSGELSPDALLRPQQGGALSLMNGDYFHERIVAALDEMSASPDDGRDVSLVVTSTALGESSRPVRDSDGRIFGEADHRRRYRFTRHGARPVYTAESGTWTFEPGVAVDHFTTAEPLATAGRASASYPGAFAPVHESQLLRERRQWPDWTTSTDADWLADGGILDNSPFQPVLESIANKPVSTPWQRTLCYVVPSADAGRLGREILSPGPAGIDTPPPPPWTSVVSAAFGLPREADFRDDIEQLHDAIRGGRSSFDIDRFHWLTVGSSAGTAAELLAQARELCTAGITLYRQSSAAAVIYEMRDLIARTQVDGYLDPSTPADALTVATAGSGSHPWLPEAFPGAGQFPMSWDWNVDATDRAVRLMLRALSQAQGVDALRAELTTHLERITALKRALDGRLVATAPSDGIPADADVVARLDAAYAELGVAAHLGDIAVAAATAYSTDQLANAVTPADVLAAALAVEVSNGAGSLPSGRARPLFRFARMGLGEAPAPLTEVYQAALGDNSANDILYGTRLSHFAAFGDSRWRAWDWMWGRLHALSHLADLLRIDSADLKRLTLAVLGVEGVTVAAVEAAVDVVLGMSAGALIDELKANGAAANTLDAAFALLRDGAATAPPLPGPVRTIGRFASDALARQSGDIRLFSVDEVVRFAAALPRHRLWQEVERE